MLHKNVGGPFIFGELWHSLNNTAVKEMGAMCLNLFGVSEVLLVISYIVLSEQAFYHENVGGPLAPRPLKDIW